MARKVPLESALDRSVDRAQTESSAALLIDRDRLTESPVMFYVRPVARPACTTWIRAQACAYPIDWAVD